jgi:AcrR family transcriptional regulator
MNDHTELSRRERKKEETRRRIFEAALELFRTRGFEATTVDEITELADVGRGTFFNYFPRKEAVLSFIAEEQVAALQELMPAMLESDEPTSALMIRLLQLAAEGYVRDKEVSRLVLTEWIKRDVQPPAETAAHAQRFFQALFQRGLARGEVRSDVVPARLEGIVKGIFLATLFQWLYCPAGNPACFDDLNAELDARLTLAVEGFAPRAQVTT